MTQMEEGTALRRRRGDDAVEESLEELYEDAPCGYLSTTPDGTIIRANRTLTNWIGYPAEDLVGHRRFSDLLTAGGRIYTETHYRPLLLLQGHAREIALDIRCADGTILPVLVNAVLVRDDDGEPKLIRTSVFDATDRREYERELLRARERAQASEERARLLAQTLQASLIPPAAPEIPGMDIGAVYRPAGAGDEVGGDFYDVFEIGRREWVVVLGDVSGKGAAAAAVTALARYTLRAAAMRSRRPSEVLRELNSALLVDDSERYCTVVCLRLRRDRHDQVVVTIASGGHPLPLLTGDGPAHPVGRTGTLLGATSTPVLRDTTIPLRPGQRLFCFTDGFTEGRRGSAFYGEDRLAAALDRHECETAADVARLITDDVIEFQNGIPRDDMAAVVVGMGGRTRSDDRDDRTG